MTSSFNSACDQQIGGPNPPRLWSRATNKCLWTVNENGIEIPSYSSSELDMRRKAEILKYKNNNAGLTKKTSWSRTVRGYGPAGNKVWATQPPSKSSGETNPNIFDLSYTNSTTLLCPYNRKMCASTTASDVPGKAMQLCLKPNVPLTRYVTRRTFIASGTKFPQSSWTRGDLGFPVGKKGKI